MQTLLFLSWVLLIVLSLWVRVGALEGRSMHADEAVQGMIFADLLENGHYAYNPRHYHGPSLYYLSLPLARARGETSAASLDETTLRMLPFLFGLFLAASPLMLRHELKFPGVLVAAGFLLLSPGLVYYSGYYIQEMLLVAGLGWFTVCSWRWLEHGRTGWAVATGLAAGLMLSSKENAPLLMLLAWAVLLLGRRLAAGAGERMRLRPALLAWAVAAALLVALPLYSSFGQNPSGILDAVRSWFVYEAGAGHEKPWYYYLSILAGWSRGPLRLGGEAGLALAGTISLVILLLPGPRHSARRPGLEFLSIGFLLLVLLSLVSYKTPWLILGVLCPLALSAGCGFSVAWDRWKRLPARIGILALLGLCWFGLAREDRWATRIMPEDERNPYAYVHTSWDIPVLAGRIHRIAGAAGGPEIKVMAEEYWPIPWYLRDLDKVGYWTGIPENPYAPVMIVGIELAGQLDSARMQDYQVEFRGLRPGRLLLVYIRRDLWEAYIGQPAG